MAVLVNGLCFYTLLWTLPKVIEGCKGGVLD